MASLRASTSALRTAADARSFSSEMVSTVLQRLEQRRGIRGGVERGKRVLTVPDGVSFSLNSNPPKPRTHYIHPVRIGRRLLTIKGPKGAVTIEVPAFLQSEPALESWADQTPATIRLSIDDPRIKLKQMMWCTVNSQIGTAMEGVTQMHQTDINLVGVGYRVTKETPSFTKKEELPPWLSGVEPKKELPRLVFRIGHPDERIFDIPEGWEADIKSPTHVVIRSFDKMKLGNYCSRIRSQRKPEPYNGKGVFLNGETIKRKERTRR